MSRYAISDIHGCHQTFDALLDRLALSQSDTLYLLGDYIDRGPGSKEVVDRILQLRRDGYEVECLLGNHEWLLLNAPYDNNRMVNWINRNGGAITLQSYNLYEENYLQAMPSDHLSFYKNLQYIIELDDYILVHAGLNFKDEDPLSDYTSMLWIRDWHQQIDETVTDGRAIVHGHTPRLYTYLEKDVLNKDCKAFDIDTGCVYHGTHFEGYLVAFDLDRRTCTFQKNIEDLAHIPGR